MLEGRFEHLGTLASIDAEAGEHNQLWSCSEATMSQSGPFPAMEPTVPDIRRGQIV